MELTVTRNEAAGRYEGRTAEGELAGFADYRDQGDTVVFPHTVTVPAYGGQGVASRITRAALDDARAAGKKVVPSCWFFAEYIDQHPEYADLLR